MFLQHQPLAINHNGVCCYYRVHALNVMIFLFGYFRLQSRASSNPLHAQTDSFTTESNILVRYRIYNYSTFTCSEVSLSAYSVTTMQAGQASQTTTTGCQPICRISSMKISGCILLCDCCHATCAHYK